VIRTGGRRPDLTEAIASYVERLVATAPPLSAEQQARLTLLLRRTETPSGRGAAA
jgi:hypothetical protein